MYILVAACSTQAASAQAPPFPGTAFIDPDIVLSSDSSAFAAAAYLGLGERFVFDRRTGEFATRSMHLFDASFFDGLTSEVQVNPEFGDAAAAEAQAIHYARTLGRLPTSLRQDVRTVTIHAGFEPFGGGNHNVLIHAERAVDYGEFLEEILFHEATHTSYDAEHADAPGWLGAQTSDGTFVSEYAQSFSDREDVAESLLPWFAVRHRGSRLDAATREAIERAIPHRLAYFDALPFVAAAPELAGDYNASGGVEQGDLDLVLLNWGEDAAARPLSWIGDLPSGLVDQDELDRVLLHWGAAAPSAPAVAIPEPTAGIMLVAGLCVVVFNAKRELTVT